MNAVVRIGSRASKLARTQVAEWLAPLAAQYPEVRFKRETILEGGDQDRITPTLAEVAKTSGGSAFSTNQEAALVAGRVDVVVHSLKDLPTAVTDGTMLLVTPGPRQDVHDVLCGSTLDDLPHGARVGTGSPRRIAQLLHFRPDLNVIPIRGNVPGRLARTGGRDGLDAVLLAAAGLNRLGLTPDVHQALDPTVFPPSPGQGALGIQVRTDSAAARLLAHTGDRQVDACVRAERALLAELHGGCSVPVGAWGRIGDDGLLHLSAAVTSLDGRTQVTATGSAPADSPSKLGAHLAADLLAQGAADILKAIRTY
ncbi:porphobilinogen deaminase [Streptomyces spiroverticillatus]|uniref:Hydroxymethylbilane synthase n=1 Tax=Streptomyces finlayi TaxID=67296 RepID=A0A918X542_9ACTN|nr:hydroxymethylbilane synthase [Streptomyces finlayi]GHA35492.1 porphobilinogen deaminase [Streptomyces spiroverticillatus]GHD12815.1 porphobilinogen deaminase [Streptomyces finlayi]